MQRRPRPAGVSAVLRSFRPGGRGRRLIPRPANDNAAPFGTRVARIAARLLGMGVVLWVASSLLAP